MRTILLCAALFTVGCAEFEPATILPARGRAYFVRELAGKTLWVCDGNGGRPVCFEASHSPAAALAYSGVPNAQVR